MSKSKQEDDGLIDWAVAALQDGPEHELPSAFLQQFQETLASEPHQTSVSVVTPIHRRPVWHKLAAAVVLLCCLSALYWWPGNSPANHSTGFLLTASEGSTRVDGEEATVVRALSLNTEISTAPNQSAILTTEDSLNRISLGPETRVSFRASQNSTSRTLELAQGSVSIGEESLKVSVSTQELMITPLGTEYRVERSQDTTQVFVLSGEVQVRSLETGLSHSLKPGQEISWRHSEPFAKAKPQKLTESQVEKRRAHFSAPKQRPQSRPQLGQPLRNNPHPQAPPRLETPGPSQPKPTPAPSRILGASHRPGTGEKPERATRRFRPETPRRVRRSTPPEKTRQSFRPSLSTEPSYPRRKRPTVSLQRPYPQSRRPADSQATKSSKIKRKRSQDSPASPSRQPWTRPKSRQERVQDRAQSPKNGRAERREAWLKNRRNQSPTTRERGSIRSTQAGLTRRNTRATRRSSVSRSSRRGR